MIIYDWTEEMDATPAKHVIFNLNKNQLFPISPAQRRLKQINKDITKKGMSNIFIKSMYLAHNIEDDNKGEGPIYATCTLGSKSSDATRNKNPPTSATFGAIPTDFELRQFYQLHNTPSNPIIFVVCLLEKLKANNALSSPTIIIILLVYFIIKTGSLMLLVLLRHIGQRELS